MHGVRRWLFLDIYGVDEIRDRGNTGQRTYGIIYGARERRITRIDQAGGIYTLRPGRATMSLGINPIYMISCNHGALRSKELGKYLEELAQHEVFSISFYGVRSRKANAKTHVTILPSYLATSKPHFSCTKALNQV